MSRIYKAEIFKLFHRRETYILIFMLLLAFGLPIGFKIAPASYALDYSFGDGRLPCSAYIVLGYAFWGTLGIFVLLFSILGVSLSSREIESHYYYLYFPRVSCREKIYTTKLVILEFFAFVWYFIYTLLFNPIGHLVLCSFRPDMAVNTMSDGSFIYWFCMWSMNLAELLFYISLVLAIGTKIKPLATISVVMVVYYICMFFYDFPLIRYIIPQYYKQSAMVSESQAVFNHLIMYTVIYIILIIAYSIGLYLYGKKQFKNINA